MVLSSGTDSVRPATSPRPSLAARLKGLWRNPRRSSRLSGDGNANYPCAVQSESAIGPARPPSNVDAHRSTRRHTLPSIPTYCKSSRSARQQQPPLPPPEVMHAVFLQGLVRMEEEAETNSTWPRVERGHRCAALEQVMTAPSTLESSSKQLRITSPLLRETTSHAHVPVEFSVGEAAQCASTLHAIAITSSVEAKCAAGSSSSIDDLMLAKHQRQQQQSAPPAEHGVTQQRKDLHSLSLELVIVSSVVHAGHTLLQQQQHAERALKSFSSPSSFLHINGSDLSLDSGDTAPGSAPPAVALVNKVHHRRRAGSRCALAAQNMLVVFSVD